METPGKLSRLPRRRLSRGRIALALLVAVVADVMQIVLGPVGWAFPDEFIDVVAMLFTIWALGFHLLLLPTFLLEFLPGVDMLPTWTGCVIAVIALRKKAERSEAYVDIPPAIPVEKSPAPKSISQS